TGTHAAVPGRSRRAGRGAAAHHQHFRPRVCDRRARPRQVETTGGAPSGARLRSDGRVTTMKALDGRVAIVTGAGGGLGRSDALGLAELGASVVVNDVGATVAGEGTDATPAEAVVEEILRAGGNAVSSQHDVADWKAAGEMLELAVGTFGRLDALVNNAGIL